MQYGTEQRVARPGTGATELVFRLDGMADIAELYAVTVANDLYRAVLEVGAVHDGVGDGLAHHLARHYGLLHAVGRVIRQVETPW